METLKQRVIVPRNREINITLKLPGTVPEGDAEILVVVSPVSHFLPTVDILGFAGALAGSERFSGDPVTLQRALRDEWR
jgi:hypothetical protein